MSYVQKNVMGFYPLQGLFIRYNGYLDRVYKIEIELEILFFVIHSLI
jgi:hypothetical protein